MEKGLKLVAFREAMELASVIKIIINNEVGAEEGKGKRNGRKEKKKEKRLV